MARELGSSQSGRESAGDPPLCPKHPPLLGLVPGNNACSREPDPVSSLAPAGLVKVVLQPSQALICNFLESGNLSRAPIPSPKDWLQQQSSRDTEVEDTEHECQN